MKSLGKQEEKYYCWADSLLHEQVHQELELDSVVCILRLIATATICSFPWNPLYTYKNAIALFHVHFPLSWSEPDPPPPPLQTHTHTSHLQGVYPCLSRSVVNFLTTIQSLSFSAVFNQISQNSVCMRQICIVPSTSNKLTVQSPEQRLGMFDVTPCLKSQGCHLIPLSYLLSCFSA